MFHLFVRFILSSSPMKKEEKRRKSWERDLSRPPDASTFLLHL
jgi:hypothetical protein